MEIISVKISRYKRFAVSNIREFELRPTKKLQTILGSNGSGKSSLIEAIVPSIPDRNDFETDGGVTREFTHRGSHYILKSTFGNKVSHSFIRNGEEENKSETAAVQKQLIKTHLGIDKDIANLLTGGEHFTSMSTGRRREWMSRLSTENYDYAFKVFNKLKESLRDTAGALKRTRERLVSETAKMLSGDDEIRIRNDIVQLQEHIERLQALRAPVDVSSEELARKLEGNQVTIEQRARTARNELHNIAAHAGFASEEEVAERLNTLRGTADGLEIVYKGLVQDYTAVSEVVAAFSQAGSADRAKVLAEIADNNKAVADLVAKLGFNYEGDYYTLYQDIERTQDWLPEFVAIFPPDQERKFSRTEYANAELRQKTLRDELAALDNKLKPLQRDLSHMEHHRQKQETKCPSCNYVWREGYAEERYQELVTKCETLNRAIEGVKEQRDSTEAYIDAYKDYLAKYRLYVQSTRGAPALSFFWDQISESELLFNSPQGIATRFHVLYNQRFDILEINNLLERNKALAAMDDALSKVDFDNANAAKERADSLEAAMEVVTKQLNYNRLAISSAQQHLVRFNRVRQAEKELSEAIARQDALLEHYAQSAYRELVLKQITELQKELASYSSIIDEITVRQNLIADLENQIKLYEVEVEAYGLLVNELSPTDGAIADGLLGFIRVFVVHVNAIIAKIWTYPLKVLPCGVSTDQGVELDYKFPIIVKETSNKKVDISEGSTGIKEMIDLAFKIAAMHFLDLRDWPLFLDEFGKSLDHAHQINSVYTIKSLLDHTDFSQLYMVSHYQTSYGALTQAEICVLCPNNIVVPDGACYNNHVTITN